MDAALGLLIFLEILLTLGIVYGALHESALIRFEHRVAAMARRALADRKAKREQKARERFLEQATYLPVKPGRRTGRTDSGAAA